MPVDALGAISAALGRLRSAAARRRDDSLLIWSTDAVGDRDAAANVRASTRIVQRDPLTST